MENPTYTHKDMASDQEVRWCPGCDDYVILRAVQKALPQMGIPKEKFAFISGIGCSSRFPYYMNTYGMHSIHGRAPAFATGVKLANPDLSVWVITGDGDSMAIGGNHFIHLIRRNIDLNLILFNNEIYGLTKGQFSPTTQVGLRTKSSPYGNTQKPFHPGTLALGANARFFARIPGNLPKHLTNAFVEAEKFHGTSIIEVLQNCVIFNDAVFDGIVHKDVRDDQQVWLEHGKPMIFGKEANKGIVLNGLKLEIVTIGENGVTEADLLVHDAEEEDMTLHLMLARMQSPSAMGIIRAVKDASLGDSLRAQMDDVKANAKFKTADDLFTSGDTWDVD